MHKILLIGAGGHARSCIDVIEELGQFEIAGLIEKNEKKIDRNLGYDIIGTDNDLEYLRTKYDKALITVGQIKSPVIRMNLYKQLKRFDFILPVIISSKAYVSKHTQIGDGSIIMNGAIVNANAEIGINCIINTRALIEHDAIIGDHCHISTGAIINGEASVGDKTFIGSGTITKQYISIGNNCIIGSGVSLKHDVGSNQVIKN
tara:strand:- start:109 stop:720 length:612 start_codon:yes stop_codon:yes gene_type:complete